MRAGDAALARLPGDVTPLVEGDSSSVRVDLRDLEGVTVAISISFFCRSNASRILPQNGFQKRGYPPFQSHVICLRDWLNENKPTGLDNKNF